MDFCSIHVLSAKKLDDSANFAAGGIVNHSTYHNSLCRDKNKHYDTSYLMVYKAMSHETLRRMRELFPPKKTEVNFRTALVCAVIVVFYIKRSLTFTI
jgi:hypothetical protein